MADQLFKPFTIDVQQKLYEKETPDGHLAVYQTAPFGRLLTLNGHIVISEQDSFLFHEMMIHPALFTHTQPEKIAILGHAFGLTDEALKHPSVKEIFNIDSNNQLREITQRYFNTSSLDDRIKHQAIDTSAWLSACEDETYDIVIQTHQANDCSEENFRHYLRILKPEGILVQPCLSSLMHFDVLKPLQQNIKQAGFRDWQILNFPQPSYFAGWRTIMMTTKRETFKRVREKDIFNRTFTTRYYNFDTHKAALAQPEFMRVLFE